MKFEDIKVGDIVIYNDEYERNINYILDINNNKISYKYITLLKREIPFSDKNSTNITTRSIYQYIDWINKGYIKFITPEEKLELL